MSDENIITGSSTGDNITYWNCTIQDADTSSINADNHHIRFWKNGFGRSGLNNFTWQNSSSGELRITIDGSVIMMSGVSTESHINGDGESEQILSMTDSNGDAFSCELVGPEYSEGSITQPLLDEQLPLLQFHLSAGSNLTWQCNTRNSSTVFSQSSFNVNSDGTMFLNGVEGNWFVDDDFYVVIATGQSVETIRDISFNTTLDSFDGLIRSDELTCHKVQ